MRTMILAVTAAAVTATGLLAGGPASASIGQCEGNSFCLWEHDNYQGDFASYTDDIANYGGYFNDKATSVYNRTSIGVNLFEHADFQGSSICIPGGAAASNLGDYGFNDRASSHRWTPGCR